MFGEEIAKHKDAVRAEVELELRKEFAAKQNAVDRAIRSTLMAEHADNIRRLAQAAVCQRSADRDAILEDLKPWLKSALNS